MREVVDVPPQYRNIQNGTYGECGEVPSVKMHRSRYESEDCLKLWESKRREPIDDPISSQFPAHNDVKVRYVHLVPSRIRTS